MKHLKMNFLIDKIYISQTKTYPLVREHFSIRLEITTFLLNFFFYLYLRIIPVL